MKWNESILFIIIIPYSRVAANGITAFLEHTPYETCWWYNSFELSRTSFSMVRYAKINIVLCHALLPGASSMFIEKECLLFRCDPTAEEEKVEDYLFVCFFRLSVDFSVQSFPNISNPNEWMNQSINQSPNAIFILYPDHNCIVLLSTSFIEWPISSHNPPNSRMTQK